MLYEDFFFIHTTQVHTVLSWIKTMGSSQTPTGSLRTLPVDLNRTTLIPTFVETLRLYECGGILKALPCTAVLNGEGGSGVRNPIMAGT